MILFLFLLTEYLNQQNQSQLLISNHAFAKTYQELYCHRTSMSYLINIYVGSHRMLGKLFRRWVKGFFF